MRDKIRRMEIRVARFATFDEAEAATRSYYRSLSPQERLEILFQLREMAREDTDAGAGRVAGVYRIAEVKRGRSRGYFARRVAPRRRSRLETIRALKLASCASVNVTSGDSNRTRTSREYFPAGTWSPR